jgi:hypothetical protein
VSLLFAPLAVTVEVRPADRRVFRLSWAIADGGVMLERPVPLEVGRPVMVTFSLPHERGDAETVQLPALVAAADADGDGENGGRFLKFIDPPAAQRAAIGRYVKNRLGIGGGTARQ